MTNIVRRNQFGTTLVENNNLFDRILDEATGLTRAA